MASTAAEGLLNWEVQPHLLPGNPAQQDAWQRNATNLIKELSDQDQATRQYQAHLESRLREERACLQHERQHSSQLQQKLADLQSTHNQVESALYQATNEITWLRQELDMQVRKSQDAESRVMALSSLNESLLKKMLCASSAEPDVQSTSVDALQIHLDLQKHEEWIKELHLSNRHHEESIRSLQAAIHAAIFATSYSGSSGSSVCTTIVGSGSGIGDEYSSELQANFGMDLAQNGQGSSAKEGSWYET
ncbi:hypothetical protein BJX63DRAFT_416414 [Aspergillus granulosus]|uniref:Uncharacterized protein n=1 Tax=Aspergillus granulosus TaxID=176169 RepID=A0ABR4GS46_9EURO